jgi:uncharacterized membrane protein
MSEINTEVATSVERDREQLPLERVIFFSDAVFAIAITLLALEIRLPVNGSDLTNIELAQALLALWPKYMGYVISFMVIGIFWTGHHRKFQYIKHHDRNLLFLNLLLLMVIAFTPFPASVISEYANSTATIFFALVMALAGILSAVLWAYVAHHNRLIVPTLSTRERRREILSPLIMSGIFLLSIGIALINSDVAMISWAFVAIPVVAFR